MYKLSTTIVSLLNSSKLLVCDSNLLFNSLMNSRDVMKFLSLLNSLKGISPISRVAHSTIGYGTQDAPRCSVLFVKIKLPSVFSDPTFPPSMIKLEASN